MNTIQLDHLEISNDQVIIIGNATSFANETRIKFADPKDLAKTLNATLKLARVKGIKVRNQKATRDLLSSLAVTTPEKIAEYNNLFDQCIAFWTPRVDVNSKTIPDYIYDECKEGYEIRNQMMAMFHRQRPLDELNEVTRRINKLVEAVERQSEQSSLVFHL